VFANLDVLVVPSQWYDFPLIIHEAFAVQTPVIATRLGGMAEAVEHDVNGLLFEPKNVEDLICQLRRICEEPGLLRRLQAGIPEVKTIAREVDELVAFYARLVARDQQPVASQQPYTNALTMFLSILMSGVWELSQTPWQGVSRVFGDAMTSMGTLL
jgi:hypothetical protein